jgi:hypothetical protein
MMGSENTRWVALSALGAAMFAFGFSFTGVACSTHDRSVTEAARAGESAADSAAQSATVLPAPAVSLGTVATVVNGAPSLGPTLTQPAPVVANGAADEGDRGLKLKRFVVTRKIENREPVATHEGDFKPGGAPVYAFVELENTGSAARGIRVLFENTDTKATVGHVKLTVPGSQPHYRTWGNTRLIRDPGHWVAVVSTADGVELGRAPFDVKG